MIPSEKSDDLKDGLVQLPSPFMSPGGCLIKEDNASGFLSLKDDKYLSNSGIEIDLSRLKNKNSNPTIDKAAQELKQIIKPLLRLPQHYPQQSETSTIAYVYMVLVPMRPF